MKKYLFIIVTSLLQLFGMAQTFPPDYPVAPVPAPFIVQVEYFIDADPGFGNGTQVPLVPPYNNTTDISGMNVTVNFPGGLSQNTHTLYIRSKDANNKWSIVNVKKFDNPPQFVIPYPVAPAAVSNIVEVEYFIDADPGFGNGTQVPLVPPYNNTTDISGMNVTVNFPGGLSQNTHTLYIRSKDANNKWSIVNVKKFDNPPQFVIPYPVAPAAVSNIVEVEYFIDADPGYGNATQVPLVSPYNNSTDISGMSITVNFPGGLSQNTHTLQIRSKDANGKWSIVNVSKFDNPPQFITPYPAAPAPATNITSVEYFIDTDPGFGNATKYTITPANNLTLPDSLVNLSNGYSAGIHHLFVRSTQGKWSITNQKDFLVYITPFTLTPSALAFGNVATGYPKLDSIIIKNVSTSTKSVNTINVPAPFSTSFSGPVNLAPNAEYKIYVSFTPPAQLFYNNVMTINTSDGAETVTLQGNGVAPVPSWAINPATTYNYGSVITGNTANANFTLINTGNTPLTIQSVTSSNTVFIPSIANNNIPIGGSKTVAVLFAPVAVQTYSAAITATATLAGVPLAITSVEGNSYLPGPPPVLQFLNTAPFSNVRGVSPEAGQPGLYTYKILYKSSANLAPQTGYPKVGIDRNNDQDFLDTDEGAFTMTKEGTSNDYVTGVVYSFSLNHPTLSSTLGYRFLANDANGNTATTINANYIHGPEITYQSLDLRLFANDITFSNSNPNANQAFTLFATLHNSSPFTANNVPVKFYKDSVLLDSAIVPIVSPYGSAIVSKNFSFPIDGFYPMKVWIDSLNTLGDGNVLNNYAIRPVTVGLFSIPGGINVTTNGAVQYCPLGVMISGTAQYFGTSNAVQPMVAGGQVSIIYGSDTVYTTTDANGQYSYFYTTGVTCGPTTTFTYKTKVTDFTVTGVSNNTTVNVPCSPVPCPSNGGGGGGGSIGSGSGGIFNTYTCTAINNTVINYTFTVTYRGVDPSNQWNTNDKILKDTVWLFQDGVQKFMQIISALPNQVGATLSFTVPLSLTHTGLTDIQIRHKYIYNEFFQTPNPPAYDGVLIPFNDIGYNSFVVDDDLPDLAPIGLTETGYASFNVVEYNYNCLSAGTHNIKIYDSIPFGTYSLISNTPVSNLNGKSDNTISYSNPSMAYGFHYIKVVADENNTVTEAVENNNILYAVIYYPRPDLVLDSVKASNSNLPPGTPVNFSANISNLKSNAGPFKVSFKANGVLIGGKKTVTSVLTNEHIVVYSDPYIVNNNDNTCPINITVSVDCDAQIQEELENNNDTLFYLGADIKPRQVDSAKGAGPAKPFIVVRGINSRVDVPIKNIGTRGTSNVNVKYMLAGQWLGNDVIPFIDADSTHPAPSGFYYTFPTEGDFVLQVTTDTLNAICEINELNNVQNFYLKVIDGKADFEVLSQYISPSNLNPNPGQSITIVGTVKNIGTKLSSPNSIRFFVDSIQLGAAVPINGLYPGMDTTVAATVSYVSNTVGAKVMQLGIDTLHLEPEIREDNNFTTRLLIYGNAPDFGRSQLQGISFNPSGFIAGDSVIVKSYIRNYGGDGGTAWLRISIKDANGILVKKDSVLFTIGAIDSAIINKKLLFPIANGRVVTEIVRSNPIEFNEFNNLDSAYFTSQYNITQATTVSGNLDMCQGNPAIFPEWIGGILLLGDNDLTINGNISCYDATHFIITNGTGKLKIVNANVTNTFPVGTGVTSPNFLVITNTGVNDNFKVKVKDGVLNNGTSGTPLTNNNVNRTWSIDEGTAGGSNATVTMYWKAQDELPGFVRNNCKTAHHFGGQWNFGTPGSAGSQPNSFYSKGQSGFTGFSPFTVTSGTVAVLPLDLIGFTAAKQDSKVLLSWKTANEYNVNRFEIQRSTSSINFIAMGAVTAGGTGNNNYNFTDNIPPLEGRGYYRLKIIDNDGSFKYSEIRMVNFGSNILYSISPNPFSSSLIIVSKGNSGTYRLTDAIGKLVLTGKINSGSQIIATAGLASGVYIITIEEKGGNLFTQKVIKQ